MTTLLERKYFQVLAALQTGHITRVHGRYRDDEIVFRQRKDFLVWNAVKGVFLPGLRFIAALLA